MPSTRPVPGAADAHTSSSALFSRRNDPGLKHLRSSLVGARGDMLKTAVFAAALLLILGAFVHHNHLASGDNQFAANAGAALAALEGSVSIQGNVLAASARAHTDVLAAAARAKVDSAAAQVGSALKSASKPAPAAAPAVKVADRRHSAPPVHHVLAALPEAHLLKVALHPHHAVEHPVKLASIQSAKANPATTPAGPMLLNAVGKASDVLGAESSKAYFSFLDLIQECTDSLSFPVLRTHAQSWMDTTISQFTSGTAGATSPTAFVSNFFNVNSAITAAAGILFLVVCMGMFAQIRNGVRGVGGRRAGV